MYAFPLRRLHWHTHNHHLSTTNVNSPPGKTPQTSLPLTTSSIYLRFMHSFKNLTAFSNKYQHGFTNKEVHWKANNMGHCYAIRPAMVAKSVEREIVCSNPWWSKTNDIYNLYLSLPSQVLGIIEDGARTGCQDNVTEWDIRSCCWWPGLPVGQH